MLVRVELDRLERNPFQTRERYGAVDELAGSIRGLAGTRPETSGLIHVPVGRVVLNGKAVGDCDLLPFLETQPEARVQLAAGHRRWAAFRRLFEEGSEEHGTFPVDVVALDDEAMASIAWAENEDREDVSPIEEARAIQRVIDELGWTQARVGKRFGLTQGAVSNKLRLLKLPQAVLDCLVEGWLTERHGRALLRLSEIGIKGKRLLRLAKHKPDRKATGPDDFLSVAELETAISGFVAAHTFKPEWDLDWMPEGEDQVCEGCKSLVRVGRTWRCRNRQCFLKRQELHKWQVKGPEKAREVHGKFSGWERKQSRSVWQRCECCGRSSDDIQDKTEWYTAQYRWVCPECWERAGLPEVAVEEAQATEVARAAVVTGGEVAPARVPEVRPVEPEEPPEPPPPPATVVVVRILDGDVLAERSVMVGIAEEGRSPVGFKVSRYGDHARVGELVAEACELHFGGNGDISREIVGEVVAG